MVSQPITKEEKKVYSLLVIANGSPFRVSFLIEIFVESISIIIFLLQIAMNSV